MTDISKIDFSPLDKKMEFFGLEKRFGQKHVAIAKKVLIGMVIAMMVMPMLVNVFAVIFGLDAVVTMWPLEFLFVIVSGFFPLVFWVAVIGGLIWAIMWKKFDEERWQEFARINQIEYTERVSGPGENRGTMFFRGHSQYINKMMRLGEDEYGRLNFTVGSGKESHHYQYTYVRVKLPKRLPNILINSRKNAVTAGLWAKDTEHLKMEGDFHKYFEVLAPKGHHLDVYQILAPDVMAWLIDCATDYDIEILDDHAYIYAATVYGAEGMKRLVTNAATLVKEFSEQTQGYTYVPREAVSGHVGKKRGMGWVWVLVIVILAVAQFLLMRALERWG
jgi:hypothetical protein